MNKSVFGFQLAYFRRQAKMTQQQLADEADCALSTISRIENGVEFPKIHLFEKFNEVFEDFGITYEELSMEEIFEFSRAKAELLSAINNGRAEELERRLSHFKELMDEDNTEHKQYYVLGYLVYMRKNGMSVEEFLERVIEAYEMRRELPKICDIKSINLSKVEHMMLYKMGMAYLEAGDVEKAAELLGALIKNRFSSKTEYFKRSCKQISASFAHLMLKCNRYDEAERCLWYLQERIVESMDSRLLFQCLMLQSELFSANDDMQGASLIDEFLASAKELINYLHRTSRARA